jgi:hypothetical protein
MRVVVTGSSGLIGGALVAALHRSGHEVTPMVRRHPLPGQGYWDPAVGAIDGSVLKGATAIVHLAGAGLGDHRWSATRKAEIRTSRVGATQLLAQAMATTVDGPRVLLSGSAVGWYGDRDGEQLTEESGPGRGFLAALCADWEAATEPAVAAGFRVVHLRTGVVLDGRGGALHRQLLLFRLGLGGRLGTGRQWLSWITLRDHVAAILHLLEDGALVGPVNLTGPSPVTNAGFTRALGKALHRPTVLAVPRLALGVVLGREMTDELVLAGQRVLPARLQASGFRFADPDIERALAAVLR